MSLFDGFRVSSGDLLFHDGLFLDRIALAITCS
jgi:hypothetical protein